MRRRVNDAIDIHGGRGICDGPSNYLQARLSDGAGRHHRRGRQHPDAHADHLRPRRAALSPLSLSPRSRRCQDPDSDARARAFERAFDGHVAFTVVERLSARLFHNLTGGLFAHVPGQGRATRRDWYRQLARASRTFALVADLTVALLGGGLKVKQKITGRMADALSELYLLSCVLKRYEDDGQPAARPQARRLLRAQNCLYRFEEALRGTIDNFPVALGALG